MLLELQSVKRLINIPEDNSFWPALERFQERHIELQDDISGRMKEFPMLDTQFHRLLYNASQNRFIMAFQDVISLIFHYRYQYQWQRKEEEKRISLAISDHLGIIDALKNREESIAAKRLERHLDNAKAGLFHAMSKD